MVEQNKRIPTRRDVENGLVPPQPPPAHEVHGEYPDVPIMDVHDLKDNVSEENLGQVASKYTSEHPNLIEKAQALGSDVVAYVHQNNKGVIFVGAGVAAVFGVAGIILYRHRKHKPIQKE